MLWRNGVCACTIRDGTVWTETSGLLVDLDAVEWVTQHRREAPAHRGAQHLLRQAQLGHPKKAVTYLGYTTRYFTKRSNSKNLPRSDAIA